MAKLAIKGHPTRGKEVIEILKMLGGKNTSTYHGKAEMLCYYIDENGKIECDKDEEIHFHVRIFTLDEFFARYPYKVGDNVKVCGDNLGVIISMRWEIDYVVYRVKLSKNGYETSKITGNLQPYKEETETTEEIKVDIPKGYEFAGIDDNRHQVVFTKIQPEYPKTYEECCEVLGWDGGATVIGYNSELIGKLQRLILFRDAYWKLAGNWKPDWIQATYTCTIICRSNNIVKDAGFDAENKILAFPTEEMRDAFYENFKELIEYCKELL